MNRTRFLKLLLPAAAAGALALAGCVGDIESEPSPQLSASTQIGINVLLNTDVSNDILADLGSHGRVRDVLTEIRALSMQVRYGELANIRALPYVVAASPDAERNGSPVDTVSASNFTNGFGTWDLDAVNVAEFDHRTVSYDGTGVYVAVVNTGLLDSWRQYFPQERVASQYGIAFGGGGGEQGSVSSQPTKWEHDQNSHGTHVASTILGYQINPSVGINGVAPMATVIPVKVLNQNGSGWSSVVARGITYVADLKAGPLAGSPVVINMSLGGPSLDAMEKAAIDYAVAQGVIVVASAGNSGNAGMGYPGAYEPVIAVAATGWTKQWLAGPSWWLGNVADPTNTDEAYIAPFSSRAKAGQDLDVAAPGTWVVGPYQVNSGSTRSFYYLSGTSMASPHVAGIAALMAQADPGLTGPAVEAILTATATPLAPGCRTVAGPTGATSQYCWGADATGAGLADAAAALSAVK